MYFYLIGKIKIAKDIVIHPTKLCEQINLIYRIIARSVYSNTKGSKFLSAAFLRIISNVFGIDNISLDEYKRMIKSLDFQIDDKNKKRKKCFKNWWWDRLYNGYQTPAEEEINYLADEYIIRIL